MKDYVNWAILAPGIIANSMAKAMSESAKTNKKVQLYAVGSRNLQRAQEFAKKWGFQKAYGSYDDLLSDPQVDAVYVCNPHAFHFESVMACLEKGKHVICEKPAGCNIDQLNKMIAKAQEKNLFFMEAMWTAFNPCIAKIKDVIKNGEIGEIKHITSRFCNRLPFDPKNRLYDPTQAGGALLDLGIYNLYFSSMINDFTPVKEHNSIVRMTNTIDAWESVNLVYENGVTANFECACDMPAGSDTHDAIIFGTKGFITTQNFFLCQNAQVHTYKNEWGNDNDITREIHVPFDVNGYEYEMLEATDLILAGKIESMVHTFEKSRELCKMMDTLRKDWNFKYPFEK